MTAGRRSQTQRTAAARRWRGLQADGEAGLRWVPRGSQWQGSRGQAQVIEDGSNDGWLGDVRNDLSAPATLRARQDIDLERSAKELRPGESVVPRGLGLSRSGHRSRGAGRRDGSRGLRDDERAEAGIGCEHAMVVDQVGTGRRDECRHQAQQLQRGQDKVGRAVWSRPLEAVAEPPVLAQSQPLQGERSPGAVPAELFKPLTVILMHVRVGVQ